MSEELPELPSLWQLHLAGAADARQRNAMFQELITAYQSAGRFYHTLDHVASVLANVEQLAALAVDLTAVRFLDRTQIFQTVPMQTTHEQPARDNLLRELAKLTAPG
ncbi:MAG: hypothetical protein ACJ8F7_11665 [Gemmataceae bacterium]